MPTLNWIGKEKVVNHHQDVPYRILEHKYGFSVELGKQENPTNSGNKIIHGDNLEALKSLLPEYEGKIKCIYIDPPYNTGNENWVYNDNVNHPKIKKWLKQVVGKQGEDLTRHDKWLCMMYPRLVLLHKLLSDDGVIFISIDDNEQASLKLVMDEIFGNSNYLTSFVWKRRSGSNDAKNFLSVDHEYIVAYQKSNQLCLNGIIKPLENYSNPDNDYRGAWTRGDLTCNKTKDERPNLYYDIIDPETGKIYNASSNRVWVYERERMQRMIEQKKVIFPKNGKGTPQYKRHLSELRNLMKPVSSWIFPSNTKDDFAGISSSINSIATKELRNIFGEQLFDYPKPVDLLQGLIGQIAEPNSLILDSFAGSGTTAHAVLNLNKQDGGNRKFILIEMEDYAETITAERVKRVINGYGEGKNAVEGTGGEFDFYVLGEPLFVPANYNQNDNANYANNAIVETLHATSLQLSSQTPSQMVLNENISEQKIREYIYFTETKQYLQREQTEQTKYLLDTYNDTGYYFYYEKDRLTVLNSETLNVVTELAGQYLIYADVCLLDNDYMLRNNIIFKKIPRDIKRF